MCFPSSDYVRAADTANGCKGSVSLVLFIDAHMPCSGMARATITATEAVTAVLQDLDLGMPGRSHASGMVIQNIAVVCNRGSELFLWGAGKHSKLGELIGRTSIGAITESVRLNGISSKTQASTLCRLQRFDISIDDLVKASGCEFNAFVNELCDSSEDPYLVSVISSMLFLNDEIRWGLVPKKEALDAGCNMLSAALNVDIEGCGDLRSALIKAYAQYIKDRVSC